MSTSAAEVRTLAREVLAPLARQATTGRVNRSLVRALGEHNLLSPVLPLGGAPSARLLCKIREALAMESPEAETAFALQGLGGHPILANGAPTIVDEWIPAIASGRAVAAFALTEPEAGSDAAALRLEALREGNAWRLTGVKTWISNAPEADVYTVFARTGPRGPRGITAFAVSGDAPGLTGRPLALISAHAIGTLEFDGVRVGPDSILGPIDGGFRVAMDTLNLFRPSVGAAAIGMAQAALDAAVAHTQSRQAFGKALRDFQAVSHGLAEVATQIEAARLLVGAAATAFDSGGQDVPKLAAMAKLFATETAQGAIDRSIQVHGAVALEVGHILEHLYRDVRALRIYEGASEIQREIIARELYR